MRFFLGIMLTSLCLSVFASEMGRNWFFGDSIGLYWDSTNTPQLYVSNTSFQSENFSCISDSNGRVRFSLSGISWQQATRSEILNAEGASIANGSSILTGHTITQGALFIPDPGNTQDTYLFHISRLSQSSSGLYFSKITSNHNGDSVSVLNQVVLRGRISEKLQAVKHANGVWWWIMVHPINSNTFISYLLTESGITDSVHSHSMISYDHLGCYYIGESQFSLSGERFASVVEFGYLHVFDFDRCNGTLFNEVLLNEEHLMCGLLYYGLSFSQDESKLYMSSGNLIFQYDLSQEPASVDTIYQDGISTSYIGQHELGFDGKIYISNMYGALPPLDMLDSFNTHLSVIHEPNLQGVASDFRPYSFSTNGRKTFLGLPNLPNYDLLPIGAFAADAGQDHSVCLGDTITLGLPEKAGILYQWQASNSLSHTNTAQPLAYPTETTTYILTIEDTLGANSCAVRNDSVTVYVVPTPEIPTILQVSDSELAIAASTDTTFSFQWYRNDTVLAQEINSSIRVIALGWYSVIITNENGCSSKSEPVYWSPVGVNETAASNLFQVTVHPSGRILSVKGVHESSALHIFDISGRIVEHSQLAPYQSQIEIQLPSGLYFYVLTSANVNRSGAVGEFVILTP